MIYAFRCGCGKAVDQTTRRPGPCPDCGGLLRRDYRSEGVAVTSILHGHFNHAVGSYVSGNREFRSELARKSDEMSARTGIESNFQPVDPRDRDAVGVTPGWEPETPSSKKIIV